MLSVNVLFLRVRLIVGLVLSSQRNINPEDVMIDVSQQLTINVN